MVVLSAPAATATNVSVTSSNPAVATATSGPIEAGSRTARLSITTGQSGTAVLIVRAGTETRSVTVVVGGASPLGIPYVFAKPVGLSLLAPPSIAGGRGGEIFAPAAALRTVRVVVLAVPATADTPVAITSSDPAIVTAASPAIVRAGEQTVDLGLSTGSAGRATLTLTVNGGALTLGVAVGIDASPGQVPHLFAKPVGLSLLAPPSIGGARGGEIFAPAAAVRTIRVVVLAAPATADTPVAITSSAPAIATAASLAIVRAGEQTVDLALSTGSAGRATLTLTVNGEALTLGVAVGIDASPGQVPHLFAKPVGLSLLAPPSIGRARTGEVFAPEGVVSLPTLKLPLLASAAAAPIQVTVTSGAPSLVSIGGLGSTTVTIAQGEQTIDLPLAIAGTRGAAQLVFEFEGQRRELLVIVGEPPTSQLPLLSSPVVGVEIRQ